MASNSDFNQAHLSFQVSVTGFGADSTGATDCRAAFDAAIEYCRARNFTTLHIPAGVYRISSFGGGVGW